MRLFYADKNSTINERNIIISICYKNVQKYYMIKKVLLKIVYFSERIPTDPSDPEKKCTEQYFLKPCRSELSFTAGT